MSARDELQKVIFGYFGPTLAINAYKTPERQDRELADAILAAGYSKPRRVSTVAELEALGHGSVIRSEHRHYWVAHKEDGTGADQGWAAAGGSALTSRDLTSWLPATVLYEPEQQ